MVVACAGVLAGMAVPAAAQVRVTYLHRLSNFEGQVPYDWGQVFVDQARDETYVIYLNRIRVFNASGMETYRFGRFRPRRDHRRRRGRSGRYRRCTGGRPMVTRCNFRGVPVGPVEITGLPEGVSFRPNRVVFRGGLLYFASLGRPMSW